MVTVQKAQTSQPTGGMSAKTQHARETADARLISAATKALLRMSGVAENLFADEARH